MRWQAAATVAILCCAGLGVGGAQQRDVFFDTVDVAVANVDVVVTDRDGQPVADLDRGDFRLLVDGQPVEVSHFFEVQQGRAVGSAATAAADPFAEGEAMPSAELQPVHVVVLVDNQNITPQSRNRVLHHLEEHLGALDPRALVMLVTLDGDLAVRVPFTTDRAVLLAAIAEMEREVGVANPLHGHVQAFYSELENSLVRHFNPSGPGDRDAAFESAVMQAQSLAQDVRVLADRQTQRVAASVQMLTGFVGSLAGIPGRKALIYVSDGLPERPAEPLVEAWSNRFDQWLMQNQEQMSHHVVGELHSLSTSLSSLSFDTSRYIGDLAREASAAGVVFYPLADVEGAAGARAVSAASRGDHGMHAVAAIQATGLETSLLQLAETTGGVALTRTADVGRILAQATRDLSSYYSLGYQPPAGGELHEVRVEVLREGLEVRHLRRQRERDPLETLEAMTLSTLRYGTDSNPLGVHLAPGETTPTGGGRYQQQVMVQIPFRHLLLLPEAGEHRGEVTLLVVVGDEEGRTSKVQRIELPIRVPNEQLTTALGGAAAYPLELEIREGRQRLAVGVRDHLARVDAATSVALEVGASR